MHRHTSHCTRGLSVEERLLHFMPDRPPDGCWPWTGALNYAGYAVLGIGKRQYRAARLAYETWVGPLGPDDTVDHVRDRGCTRKDCGAPHHLEAVTSEENIRRGDGVHMQNARKETCLNGHPFDLVRVIGDKEYRDCSTCRRARGRKYDAKRRPPVTGPRQRDDQGRYLPGP